MTSGPFDVLALVASTGGHAAIATLVCDLPPDFQAPIVVMQHLGPESTSTVELYRRRLPFAVEWVRADSALAPRTVLVCPPRSFLELLPDGTCILSPCERGAVEKPLDRFLDSIARSFGPRAIGVVLTGMGSDGALGARQLHLAGGRVLVQSDASASSPDMPKAAIQAAAADLVAPLEDLGQVVGEIVAGTPQPQPRSEIAAIRATFGDKGQIAALARDTNWSATAMGPVREWSPVLRGILRLAMGYPTPFSVLWGPQLIHFYNDAGRATLGEDHPRVFGRPSSEGSREMRDTFEALWRKVLAGETIHHAARLVPTMRTGKPADAWFDFVHSPVREADGTIGGVATVSEDRTDVVLASRRLQTLHALRGQMSASHRREALVQALELLGKAPDVPFAVAYEVKPGRKQVDLVGAAGVAAGGPLAPWIVTPTDDGWSLADVIDNRRSLFVDDVAARFPHALAREGQSAPEHAVLHPLIDKANKLVAGVLILGVHPRLTLDEPYREFLRLAAEVVASQLTEAHTVELERERLDRLAELDRTKTEFFANVSHEFRTPLTLLLAPLEEMLRRREELPATLAQELDVAASNSRRLLRLVNNLLDFSQLDTRRRQAAFAPTDLSALTADIASAFRSAIEAAGLSFRVECDPNLQPVWIDRAMWETIVSNLVANAFKFTFDGEIAVELRGLSLHAQLIVRDTGIGIPERELPNLFKRFHRIRDARARTVEGAGIGLSLVDDLVKRLGGQLRVRSTEGRGTVFTIWILYKAARIKSDASTSSGLSGELAEALAKDATRWLSDADQTPGDVSEDLLGAPLVDPQAPRGTIMVVDDNADLRRYLQRLLSPRWAVELAPDGESALNAAARQRPDLFLADVMMPGLDGFQFIQRVREHPKLQHTPVVLLTARAGEEAAIEGLRAGATDYIAKPFSPRELVARIQAAVDRARAEAALRESEAKFRTVFETMIEACCIFELIYDDLGKPVDWKILEANPGYEKQSGLKDVAGKLASEVMAGTEAYWIETFGRVVETGEAEQIEKWHQPTGRWIHSSTARVGGSGSRRLASVFYDITERKRAEERQAYLLRLSDALRPLSDPLEIQAVTADLLGPHLKVNQAYYGEVAGEYLDIRHSYVDGLPPMTGRFRYQDFGERLVEGCRTGQIQVCHEAVTDPLSSDAERRVLASAKIGAYVAAPLVKGGEWIGTLAVHSIAPRTWKDWEIEIVYETAERTWAALERARAEQALRASAREYAFHSAVLQSVSDPLWVSDSGLRITYWNESAAAAFGWTADEVLGRHTGELFQTLVRGSSREAAVEQVMQKGEFRGEIVVRCKDGRSMVVEASSRAVRGPDGEVTRLVHTVRDISERKRVENALRESEARLGFQASLLANAAEAMTATDHEFVITYWNRAAEELFGWSASEVLGRPSEAIFRTKVPGSNRKAAIAKMLEQGGYRGEVIYRRKDGRPVLMDARTAVLRGPSGELLGTVTAFREITARKKTRRVSAKAKKRS